MNYKEKRIEAYERIPKNISEEERRNYKVLCDIIHAPRVHESVSPILKQILQGEDTAFPLIVDGKKELFDIEVTEEFHTFVVEEMRPYIVEVNYKEI